MSRRLIRTVEMTQPVKTSNAGNVTHRVTFTDGSSYLTEVDSHLGQVITNQVYKDVPHCYTVTARKRLTRVSADPVTERPIAERTVHTPDEPNIV